MPITKKICLLGDFAVGKTSLVRRFIYDLFDESYLSTIGVKVSRKVIIVPQQGDLAELALMVWDIAGNNGFHEVRTSYLRGSAGAILVCDQTRPETLANLRSYVSDLHSVSPAASVIIAANKHDLVDQLQITAAEVESFASSLNTTAYMTSARTGSGVEDLFRHLGTMLLP